MKHRAQLVILAVVLTTSACERTSPPTALPDGPDLAVASATGRYRSFRIPTANSQPRHITLGSDGNMWFTESNINVNQIGRVVTKPALTKVSAGLLVTRPACPRIDDRHLRRDYPPRGSPPNVG